MNFPALYKTSLKSLPAIMLSFLLIGCVSYGFNGKSYDTREEAVAALINECNQDLALVEPVSERIGGRALIVAPDRKRLKESGPQAPSWIFDADYFLDVYDAEIECHAKAIIKSELFDEVAVQRVYETVTPQANADYIIWFSLQSRGRTEVYFLSKRSAKRRVIQIDKHLPRNERWKAWLNVVFVLAKDSQGP